MSGKPGSSLPRTVKLFQKAGVSSLPLFFGSEITFGNQRVRWLRHYHTRCYHRSPYPALFLYIDLTIPSCSLHFSDSFLLKIHFWFDCPQVLPHMAKVFCFVFLIILKPFVIFVILRWMLSFHVSSRQSTVLMLTSPQCKLFTGPCDHSSTPVPQTGFYVINEQEVETLIRKESAKGLSVAPF